MMSRGSILFVDDDHEMVDSFSRWFRRKGYQTTQTYDVLQSRSAMAEYDFDVAVIDIGLPDSDGFDFLDELVRRAQFPVIVLSGLSNREIESTAIKHGAFRYLLKPAKLGEIEHAIEQAARQSLTTAAPSTREGDRTSQLESTAKVER